jgi:YebC/PmpR family DNA-binding regulatory protein
MGRIGTIINRKAKQDAKKANAFTKLGRLISVAAREGGSDLEYNVALKNAVEKAKAENMPNDNIERAIKKGAGELEGVSYEEMTYEGYGPNGIAVMIEILTDNKNRTAADIRHYFTKCGGNLGANGCVSFMFDHLGVLVVKKDDQVDEETLMMASIEAGADDFVVEEDHFEIYTEATAFGEVRDALKEDGYTFEMAELRFLPQTTSLLEDEESVKQMTKLLDLLDENDDVQNVYHNWEETDPA